MTKEDLSKLIDECCDDIFDRKEPLVNVKARLYYTLKKQLTLTDVSQRSELYFAFMEEYNALMGKSEHQILKEEVIVLLAKYSG